MHACVLSHVHFLATLWTVAARLLCPWDFPGKNTGVGYHFLLWRSSWSRDQTHVSYVSCTAGRFFTAEPPGKPLFQRGQPSRQSIYHTHAACSYLCSRRAIIWEEWAGSSSLSVQKARKMLCVWVTACGWWEGDREESHGPGACGPAGTPVPIGDMDSHSEFRQNSGCVSWETQLGLGGESCHLCLGLSSAEGMGMPASCLPLARTVEFLGMADPSQEKPLGTAKRVISFLSL